MNSTNSQRSHAKPARASSRFGWLRSAGSTLVALLALGVAARADEHSDDYQFGLSVYKNLVSEGQIVSNSPYNFVLQRVGRRIAGAAGKQWYTERFYVVRGNAINAYSAPGGFVFINEGLLDGVQNVDELANVLGHETGHLVHGDVRARNNVENKENLIKNVGKLFVHSTGGENTIDYTTGVVHYAYLNFSREQELAADEYGADVAAKAGFNPWGTVWFFLEVERLDGDAGYEKYLQQHPSTSDRIKNVESHFRADPARFRRYRTTPASTSGLPEV